MDILIFQAVRAQVEQRELGVRLSARRRERAPLEEVAGSGSNVNVLRASVHVVHAL